MEPLPTSVLVRKELGDRNEGRECLPPAGRVLCPEGRRDDPTRRQGKVAVALAGVAEAGPRSQETEPGTRRRQRYPPGQKGLAALRLRRLGLFGGLLSRSLF